LYYTMGVLGRRARRVTKQNGVSKQKRRSCCVIARACKGRPYAANGVCVRQDQKPASKTLSIKKLKKLLEYPAATQIVLLLVMQTIVSARNATPSPIVMQTTFLRAATRRNLRLRCRRRFYLRHRDISACDADDSFYAQRGEISGCDADDVSTCDTAISPREDQTTSLLAT
jgi:hypothetical protein